VKGFQIQIFSQVVEPFGNAYSIIARELRPGSSIIDRRTCSGVFLFIPATPGPFTQFSCKVKRISGKVAREAGDIGDLEHLTMWDGRGPQLKEPSSNKARGHLAKKADGLGVGDRGEPLA
jgi:hypothetical protein